MKKTLLSAAIIAANFTFGQFGTYTFDFNDFVDQLQQVQKMGPLDQIMKMIPGLSNNST